MQTYKIISVCTISLSDGQSRGRRYSLSLETCVSEACVKCSIVIANSWSQNTVWLKAPNAWTPDLSAGKYHLTSSHAVIRCLATMLLARLSTVLHTLTWILRRYTGWLVSLCQQWGMPWLMTRIINEEVYSFLHFMREAITNKRKPCTCLPWIWARLGESTEVRDDLLSSQCKAP